MGTNSIHEAAASGNLDAVRELLESDPSLVDQDDEHDWRPVFHAGLNRHHDIVKCLIDHGADLSAHDGYVMHYAGQVPDNKDILFLLVSYGGLDAHAKPSSELARQFINAVFFANSDRVRSMLRSNPGLALECYARGDTALHHACRNGDLEIVTLLVGSGAEVDASTDHGHFPLYCAAGHGHAQTTRFLLDSGADTQARLQDGKTVAEWLVQYADRDRRLRSCLDVLGG
jgi:ankyrin repeat protein